MPVLAVGGQALTLEVDRALVKRLVGADHHPALAGGDGLVAEEAEGRNVPTWLARDLNSLSGRMLRNPERAEIDGNLNEQLIVEYYSR